MFQAVQNDDIPIAILLGGGYQVIVQLFLPPSLAM